MSDLLDLIRKTQPLYNHLSPAEAKILDELVAAAHDLQEQLVKARAALEECEVVFGLVEHPRRVDPHYGDQVRALGDRIGYGALMSSASASWREYLYSTGQAGAEFVAGPCYATVIKVLAQVRASLSDEQHKEKSDD